MGIWLYDLYMRILSTLVLLIWGNTLQKPATLVDLPPELFLHVATYLDHQELLALRPTCKTLEALTRTRGIWVKLMMELQQSYQVAGPEEELESYTTEELERWVIKRSSAQSVILGSVTATPRGRTLNLPFPLDESLWSRSHLLPGGRWLLIYCLASCYSVDLDSPNPEPVLLFDVAHIDKETANVLKTLYIDRDAVHPDIPMLREIWIDDTKERLSFRVLVHYGSVYQNVDPRVHVYQIELVGHGKSATLAAERLASFYCMQSGLNSHVFNGHYIIEAKNGEDVELRIFHYTPIIGCFTEMARVSPLITTLLGFHDYVAELQFIRGNMFLIVTPQDLRIIEIIHDPVTMVPQSMQLRRTIPYCMTEISRLLSNDDGFQITWFHANQYHKLWVPHNGDGVVIKTVASLDPEVTAACKDDSQMVVGISSSLIFEDQTTMIEIISHSTYMRFIAPDREELLGLGIKPHLYYNHDVGRIVFSEYACLVVVDLA